MAECKLMECGHCESSFVDDHCGKPEHRYCASCHEGECNADLNGQVTAAVIRKLDVEKENAALTQKLDSMTANAMQLALQLEGENKLLIENGRLKAEIERLKAELQSEHVWGEGVKKHLESADLQVDDLRNALLDIYVEKRPALEIAREALDKLSRGTVRRVSDPLPDEAYADLKRVVLAARNVSECHSCLSDGHGDKRLQALKLALEYLDHGQKSEKRSPAIEPCYCDPKKPGMVCGVCVKRELNS